MPEHARAHRSWPLEDREKQSPRMQFDVARLKADGTFFEDVEEIERSNIYSTMLVGSDMRNGACVNAAAGADSNEDKYTVANIIDWRDRESHRKVKIRCDNEPAARALFKGVKAARVQVTDLQDTPERSSQSLGGGERAVQMAKGMSRVSRYMIEAKHGVELQHDMPTWARIMRAVGWAWARVHARASGRTAYEEYADSSSPRALGSLGRPCSIRKRCRTQDKDDMVW